VGYMEQEGGLLIGFLTGLFTAEIYDDQLNTQIQSEQTKDKLLEAMIEQELERQRQLETQLLNCAASPQENHAGLPPSALSPRESTGSRVATNDGSSTLASLSKKESPSNSRSPFKHVEMRDIIGVAKAGWTLDQLKSRARDSVSNYEGLDPAAFAQLSRCLRYIDGDYANPATFQLLRRELADAAHPTHSCHPTEPFRDRHSPTRRVGLC